MNEFGPSWRVPYFENELRDVRAPMGLERVRQTECTMVTERVSL